MFERFTERARKVVVLAQEAARDLGHDYIGTEHLLLGLLREKEGVAGRALRALGVTFGKAHDRVADIVGYGEEGDVRQAPFTPRSKRVIELSLREALDIGHNHIGTEHLLLGLVGEGGGVASRVLLDLGAEPDFIRREVVRMLRDSSSEGSLREEPSSIPGEAMFRGRVAGMEAGSLAWDLEYEHVAREADEEGVDHDELVAVAVGVLEEMGELDTIEEAVAMIGARVLGGFPVIRTVTVSARWSRRPITLPAYEAEVGGTFRR